MAKRVVRRKTSSKKVVRRKRAEPVAPEIPATDPTFVKRVGTLKVHDGGLFDGQPHDVSLGIDPGTANFAFLAYDAATDKSYGWHVHPGNAKGVDRLVEVQKAVQSFIGLLQKNGCTVEHICLEGYAPNMKFGREEMGEGAGAIKLALRTMHPGLGMVGYPTIIAPTKLKKYATGKGTGDKSIIKLAVYKKWSVEIRNEHICDGYVLARIASAVHSPSRAALAYEKEVLHDLQEHTEWERPQQEKTSK